MDLDVETAEKQIPELYKEAAAVFFLVLVLAWFFYPFLFGSEVFFFRDLHSISYPIRYFLSQSYNQGAIPFWGPQIAFGIPFMAEFHMGVFYPPSLIFFLDDFTFAFNIFFVFHFFVLSVSVYFLVKSWKCSRAAAFLSGITAMLSGVFMSAVLVSNCFFAAVWLPLIFIFFHQYLQTKKKIFFVGAVIWLTVQVLSGCPEVCVMTMVLLFFYSVLLVVERNVREWGRCFMAQLSLVAAALGLSALQLLPTYKLIPESIRSGGLPFDIHTLWSFSFDKFSELFLPPGMPRLMEPQIPIQLDYLQSVYMGLLPFLFFVVAFLFLKKRPIRFWLGVIFVGVFLALGKNNPIYQYLYPWNPLLQMFRYPEKYFYVSAFGFIFLFAFSLDEFISRIQKKEINIRAVMVIIFFLFAALVGTAILYPDRDPIISLIILACFFCVCLMFYFKKINAAVFVLVLISLVLADFQDKNKNFLNKIDKSYYEEVPLLAKLINKSEGHFRTYSGNLGHAPGQFFFPNAPTRHAGFLAGKEQMIPFIGLVYGIEYPVGMPALGMGLADPMTWIINFTNADPGKRLRILERSNVKYWVDGDTQTQFQNGVPQIEPARIRIFNKPLSRAFIVPKAISMEENKILDAYYDQSYDPLSAVLLGEPVNHEVSPDFGGKVESIEYGPNRVTVRTHQQGSGFLVLLDSYFPGWTVKVDGREGKIFRANHYYRAVHLGSGNHTVEFEFVPEGFHPGLLISGMTLVLVVGGLFVKIGNKKSVA